MSALVSQSTQFNAVQLPGILVSPRATPVTATLVSGSGNITRFFANVMPADGEPGYTPASYAANPNGGFGTSAYINEGSTTSCLFSPLITTRGSFQTTVALGATQNSTPTVAQLRGTLLTQISQTGAGTVTLPTGTLLSASFGTIVGSTFRTLFANTGTQTLTITAGAGDTIVGTSAIPAGKNATLIFTNTGTNTWNVYTIVSA